MHKCKVAKNNTVLLEYQHDLGLSLDYLAFDLGDEHLLSMLVEEHQEGQNIVFGKPSGHPRGDPIIDLCSFNEGSGIHKENALSNVLR